MSGFSSWRIIDIVFWSWTSPRMDRYSHCTGTITLSAAVNALMVSRPSRAGVDAHEVVVLEHRPERLLERALSPDLRAHGDLGARQVDRGAGHVDLALADHLAVGMWLTSTSYIDFSTESGSMPWLMVRLP